MRQKLENIRLASIVYDRHGRVVGNLYDYRRVWVPLSQIPVTLQRAVVAIEDARFYKHKGIDFRAMGRALVHNIIPGGEVEGGSTITQQLAKISLLSHERTVTRKAQDIFYALKIEQAYTKKEILELYLNNIYLGHGNIGVEAASRYYFGKPVESLNLAESALLAGIIRSPENYSPVKHPKTSKARRNLVLKKMFALKWINKNQYQAAVAQEVKTVKQKESAMVAGYFLDYIKGYLLKNGFSEEQLRFGGYRVYSTLDAEYQKKAEQIMALYPEKVPAAIQPQGALLTLSPESGEIRAGPLIMEIMPQKI